MTRHLLSIDDLSPGELAALIDQAKHAKARPGDFRDALDRRTLLMIFAKPSLRTRVSFETGMTQMGGHAISYPLAESTVGHKETLQDLAAAASRYADVIMARLHGQNDLADLAAGSRVPVINGLTDHEHPCQAIADLMTLHERLPSGMRLAFLGDGGANTCHSLLLGGAMLGVNVTVGCPREHMPDAGVVARAREHAKTTGARIVVTHDAREAAAGADAVYTDTWMSYHVPGKERTARVRRFTPFRVDAELMKGTHDALFLHCLPATRGEEVTDDVLDSPRSIVFDQAENRLHAQKALLLFLLRPSLARALA